MTLQIGKYYIITASLRLIEISPNQMVIYTHSYQDHHHATVWDLYQDADAALKRVKEILGPSHHVTIVKFEPNQQPQPTYSY